MTWEIHPTKIGHSVATLRTKCDLLSTYDYPNLLHVTYLQPSAVQVSERIAVSKMNFVKVQLPHLNVQQCVEFHMMDDLRCIFHNMNTTFREKVGISTSSYRASYKKLIETLSSYSLFIILSKFIILIIFIFYVYLFIITIITIITIIYYWQIRNLTALIA